MGTLQGEALGGNAPEQSELATCCRVVVFITTLLGWGGTRCVGTLQGAAAGVIRTGHLLTCSI